MAKLYSPVVVTWNDAHGSSDAAAIYEVGTIPHGALQVETYGILVQDDEEGVSVCCEVLEGGGFRGHTFILRPLIVSVDDLRRYKQRKTRAKRHTAGHKPDDVEPGSSGPTGDS